MYGVNKARLLRYASFLTGVIGQRRMIRAALLYIHAPPTMIDMLVTIWF